MWALRRRQKRQPRAFGCVCEGAEGPMVEVPRWLPFTPIKAVWLWGHRNFSIRHHFWVADQANQ